MKFRETSNSNSDSTAPAAGSTARHRRWLYSIALCVCFGCAIYFLRMSPAASGWPSQPGGSCPVTTGEKCSADNGGNVPIVSSSPSSSSSSPTSASPSATTSVVPLPATLLPEIDAYVDQMNALRNGPPKFWSFPGKTEKYDMNAYNFKFDPRNPKCPEPLLRATEKVTHCPNEDTYLALWMLIRDQRRPENRGRPLTLVDVGSNKGYSIATMLETLNLTVPERTTDVADIHYVDPKFLPNSNSSSASLTNNDVPGFFSREALVLDAYVFAEKLNTLPIGRRNALAGACCDGTAKSPFHPISDVATHPWLAPSGVSGGRRRGNVYVPEVEAFLIDGTRSHVEYVTQFFNGENNRYEAQATAKYNREKQLVQPPPPTKLSFHYFLRAMSSRNGMTKFCDPPFGMENGVICDQGVATTITTLDRLIPAHVQKIDILLTDTEGHDFDVLEGARERWLRDGKVGIYIFETHRGPNKRPLSSIIGELEGYGYTCYIPVRCNPEGGSVTRHVVRVSPMELCWRPDYDSDLLRGWRNMMCAHETNFPELKFVLQELSKLGKKSEIMAPVRCELEQRIVETHPWRNFSWMKKTGN